MILNQSSTGKRLISLNTTKLHTKKHSTTSLKLIDIVVFKSGLRWI